MLQKVFMLIGLVLGAVSGSQAQAQALKQDLGLQLKDVMGDQFKQVEMNEIYLQRFGEKTTDCGGRK